MDWLVPYCNIAAVSLMAILLYNKLSLSILLVDDGALDLPSRVLVLCDCSERYLLILCGENRVLGIPEGPFRAACSWYQRLWRSKHSDHRKPLSFRLFIL